MIKGYLTVHFQVLDAIQSRCLHGQRGEDLIYGIQSSAAKLRWWRDHWDARLSQPRFNACRNACHLQCHWQDPFLQDAGSRLGSTKTTTRNKMAGYNNNRNSMVGFRGQRQGMLNEGGTALGGEVRRREVQFRVVVAPWANEAGWMGTVKLALKT